MSHEKVGHHEKKLQMMGQMAGFDWMKAWEVIQKVSPQLQALLMSLLDAFAEHPAIVGATIPNTQMPEPTYAMCEAVIQSNQTDLKNLDPASLLALLQVVGPFLSQLILKLLKQKNPPINEPVHPNV